MQNNKIKTYINFAIKSNKIVYGLDNISAYNKKAFLIIIDEGVNAKFKQNIINIATKLQTPLVEAAQEILNEMLNTSNCKAILLRNKSLADAIIKENLSTKTLREVNLIESNN